MELRRQLNRARNIARASIAVVCSVAVLWLVVYRLVIAFTPLWLDLITCAAGGLGALILWLLDSQTRSKT